MLVLQAHLASHNWASTSLPTSRSIPTQTISLMLLLKPSLVARMQVDAYAFRLITVVGSCPSLHDNDQKRKPQRLYAIIGTTTERPRCLSLPW